jgi:para-aminobenzoate synthetase/4-amino-4-deoxychorismate lyase
LEFQFDRHAARNELQAATFRRKMPAMVRLLLSPKGSMAIELKPVPPPEPRSGRRHRETAARGPVRLPPALQNHRQGFLKECPPGHRCVRSGVHRSGRAADRRQLHQRFRRAGRPYADSAPGARPASGLLRQRLIDEGKAEEADLSVEDLKQGFLIGNMVRGLMKARLA